MGAIYRYSNTVYQPEKKNKRKKIKASPEGLTTKLQESKVKISNKHAANLSSFLLFFFISLFSSSLYAADHRLMFHVN